MSKMIVRAAIIAGLTVLSIETASAQSPGFCNEYANQAVISASQNRGMGCGYSGLRWSFSYQAHFNWCMSSNPNNAMSERFTRKHMIQACRG
jgi:hypothetical protein